MGGHYEGDGCEWEFGPGTHNLGAAPLPALRPDDAKRLGEFRAALAATKPRTRDLLRQVRDIASQYRSGALWSSQAMERISELLDEDCACRDTFNPKCPEHGGNEHRP